VKLRAFGILGAKHELLGALPSMSRPHVEIGPPGMVWGHDLYDVTRRAAEVAREARGRASIPLGAWLALLPWQRDQLLKRGIGLPRLAGAGQQESYRSLAASFAITSTIHAHQKLLGGTAQQAVLTMLETSWDGTSGIATLEIDSSTEATAGTAGTAPTVTQVRKFPAITAATTCSGNYTAEGTTYTAINLMLLPMPIAPLIVQYPLGRELETQPTAATNAKALLIRGSTTVNCNERSMVEFEE
jgi:hypothetical protein